MLSSWDQLRFAQQQTAWLLVSMDAMVTGADEYQNGWSTQNTLSRTHPVGQQANGEPLSNVRPSRGTLSPRENYKLRGLVQLDNRLGFAGYVWDPFLKMYHVRHRVLNPRLGIWMQPDPIGYAGGWNLHEYCGGDPLGFVDPMGLDFIDSVKDLIGDAVDGIQEGWDLFTGAAAQRDSAWDSASAKAVAGCVRQAKQLEQQGELEKAGKVRCQCSQMMGGLRGAMNQLAGIRQKQWKEIGDTARNAMVAPAGVFVAPATLIGQVAFNVAGNVGLELWAGGDLRSAAIDGLRDGAMAWGLGKALGALHKAASRGAGGALDSLKSGGAGKRLLEGRLETWYLDFARRLDVKVVLDSNKLAPKMAGMYSSETKTIYLSWVPSRYAAFHELGHAVHHAQQGSAYAKLSPLQREQFVYDFLMGKGEFLGKKSILNRLSESEIQHATDYLKSYGGTP